MSSAIATVRTKAPQPRGAAATHEREHAEGEGRVGGHDHAPAARRVASRGEGEIDHDREQHPAERRERRHCGAPAVAELAHVELAPHLEPDDEKEERHQPVVDPVVQVALQTDLAEAERELGRPQAFVARAPRGIGPHQRSDGRDEQKDRAAYFGLQKGPQRRGNIPRPGRPGKGARSLSRRRGLRNSSRRPRPSRSC